MKFIWNWLSGKTYTESSGNLISEDGRVFTKTPGGFMSENGDFIQQVGNNYVNHSTGDWSVHTDVFDNGHRTF